MPRRVRDANEQRGTGALTPFQAFMTALAASIGTGNIAGVATAIVSGGPGALFWIWVYGFVAMAIKFGEAVLGITFRETARRDGLVRTDVLPARRPALAVARVDRSRSSPRVAALTTTPFTQPNSMALVLEHRRRHSEDSCRGSRLRC